MFRNKASFYGEALSTPRPTPKLEDHPLSAVRGCLFITFLYNITQNILKYVTSHQEGSTEATRGYGGVPHVFQLADHVFGINILQNPS
jgi:hypothetical protein